MLWSSESFLPAVCGDCDMRTRSWLMNLFYHSEFQALPQLSPTLHPANQSNFFFFGYPRHMELVGQGSDLSHGRKLRLSCGNAGSLTHRAQGRIDPKSQCSQNAANPIVLQWELPERISLQALCVKFDFVLNWKFLNKRMACENQGSVHSRLRGETVRAKPRTL